jgi:hypothetical protein
VVAISKSRDHRRVCRGFIDAVDGFRLSDAWLLLRGVHAGRPRPGCCCLAFGNADRVANTVAAETVTMARDFKVRNGGLWDREGGWHDLRDSLRGMRQEGEGRKPYIMPLWRGSREFECPCRCENQDRSVEEGRCPLWSGIVVFNVEDGLNSH